MSGQTFPPFVMAHREARVRAMAAVMECPDGWSVTLKPPGRSLDQNSLLHARLADIARSGFALNGRRLTIDELKTAFVSGWMIEQGYTSDIISGFRDEPVQLRRSTTTFSKEELGGLLDYIDAECAQRGIKLRAPA